MCILMSLLVLIQVQRFYSITDTHKRIFKSVDIMKVVYTYLCVWLRRAIAYQYICCRCCPYKPGLNYIFFFINRELADSYDIWPRSGKDIFFTICHLKLIDFIHFNNYFDFDTGEHRFRLRYEWVLLFKCFWTNN